MRHYEEENFLFMLSKAKCFTSQEQQKGAILENLFLFVFFFWIKCLSVSPVPAVPFMFAESLPELSFPRSTFNTPLSLNKRV